MKKSWIVLVALFVVVMAVAAQVAAQDSGTLSGTVRVGSWESGDALTPWNNAIAAFEAENPGVDIQLEAVPQDYGTKLLAQFAAGNAPDIFMSGDGDVAKWQAAVRQWGIQWTFLPPGKPLVRLLDSQPGWRRLYADPWAVIHVKDTAARPGDTAK